MMSCQGSWFCGILASTPGTGQAQPSFRKRAKTSKSTHSTSINHKPIHTLTPHPIRSCSSLEFSTTLFQYHPKTHWSQKENKTCSTGIKEKKLIAKDKKNKDQVSEWSQTANMNWLGDQWAGGLRWFAPYRAVISLNGTRGKSFQTSPKAQYQADTHPRIHSIYLSIYIYIYIYLYIYICTHLSKRII